MTSTEVFDSGVFYCIWLHYWLSYHSHNIFFFLGAVVKAESCTAESIKAKGFMNRGQNRLILTLVAHSWIQRKLTHQSPHIQSHGSTLILS